MFKDKNILFITHSYRNWVKARIESIADNFNKIYVLVRYKPIAKIGYIFNSDIFKMHTKGRVFEMENIPANVKVIPTPLWYLPTENGYFNLGEKHFKTVKKIIEKKKINFDIIHSHFAWSAGFVGTKLRKIYNVPLVITTHAYDVNDLPFRSNKWAKKIQRVLSDADHVITVSEKNKEYIDKINIDSPISIIPNGFRKNYFYPKDSIKCRKRLKLPLNKRLILTIGNLDKVKGQKYLIDALKILIKIEKILCIIIGEGPNKRKLDYQIKLNNLEQYVWLIGFKDHHDLVDWINACDVFVLPSISEGNPTVMFESMACGKPFVGTSVGGIPEYITSDDHGILVKPKNSKLLAKALLDSLERNWDSKLIIEHSKQYDWGNLCKEKVNIYSSLINNS